MVSSTPIFSRFSLLFIWTKPPQRLLCFFKQLWTSFHHINLFFIFCQNSFILNLPFIHGQVYSQMPPVFLSLFCTFSFILRWISSSTSCQDIFFLIIRIYIFQQAFPKWKNLNSLQLQFINNFVLALCECINSSSSSRRDLSQGWSILSLGTIFFPSVLYLSTFSIID